jgi:RimJ/RimL family protein N-acetyltransferase
MLTIREVEESDCDLIYDWRNQPFIMNLGGSKSAVSLQEHVVWFGNSLKSKKTLLYITVVDGLDAGLTRFDFGKLGATISIYLLEEFTGKGFGVEVFRLARDRMLYEWPSVTILADVQIDNVNSRKYFERLGFVNVANDEFAQFRLESH